MNLDFASLKARGIIVKKQEDLSSWTTFQLGGACSYLLLCSTADQLEITISSLVEHDVPFIIMGGGSNLVVSDQGIDCWVVRYYSQTPIITHRDNEIVVSGSTLLDHLAFYAADHGLEGVNFTSGIPGTVGGAIVGNAGAFGKQVGDVLKCVALMSLSGKKFTANTDELGFSYRHSKLKETGDIVISATFNVNKSDRETLLQEREKTLALRWEKHPDLKVYPCAGSFFRNVEPTSKAQRRQATGWFLEQAGGKQLFVGGAKIFPKHANIIIKTPGCTAKDVYELSQKMADLVKKNYNIDLVREVRFVGKIDGLPVSQNHLIW